MRSLSRVIGAILLGSFMIGCVSYAPASTVYMPDQAGVVLAEPSESNPAYVLEQGGSVTLSPNDWISGSGARQGDLLLVGGSPQKWGYAVRSSQGSLSSNCFAQFGAAWKRGPNIDVLISVNAHDAYLRLSEAPGFEPQTDADGRLIGSGALCLNSTGQVVRQNA